MKLIWLVLAATSAVLAADPPSCRKPIYCDSELLHYVQTARLFPDSKTFVDRQMKNNEKTILSAFEILLNTTNHKPTNEELSDFVNEHFEEGNELEIWTPCDFTTDPEFLKDIRDDSLRLFGKDINNIWPTLGRKVRKEVFRSPDQYSLIPITHGFIIPGGRFKEIYYWDTYWIIEGLLVSGMKETAKGMIENLLELLNDLGHIPNGSRWYYEQRSQPPLLTAMAKLYYKYTKDVQFIEKYISLFELELDYWLDTQIVTFEIDDKSYTMLRYYAPSTGPRPESYFEDFKNAQVFHSNDRQQDFYTDIKSAAESGWDFSSRWFISNSGDNDGNLTNIHTKHIIPVDLNAIYAGALQNVAHFHGLLGNPKRAAHWAYLAKQWRSNIEKVLWHEKDGVWYDYDMQHGKHRQYFYPSNVAPLWIGTVEDRFLRKHTPKIMNYLKVIGALKYPGGVPTSFNYTKEQWDFPNAWPPLVSVVVNALEALDTKESQNAALDVAQTWVRACHKGFQESHQMYEKYNAETPGQVGGEGEYTVQNGFGWSNGVVLEFLAKYGNVMTLVD